MVGGLNRSILQMLRSYVTKETDWEQYLLLIMYAYCTTVHSSTQKSPFQLCLSVILSSTIFITAVALMPSYGRQL